MFYSIRSYFIEYYRIYFIVIQIKNGKISEIIKFHMIETKSKPNVVNDNKIKLLVVRTE